MAEYNKDEWLQYDHYTCHNDRETLILKVSRTTIKSIIGLLFTAVNGEPVIIPGTKAQRQITLKRYKNKGWFESSPIGFESSNLIRLENNV